MQKVETNSEELFKPVLDDDETVVKVIRPHKGRAWFTVIFLIVFVGLLTLPLGILFTCGVVVDDDGTSMKGFGLVMLAFWGILVLIATISVVLWCHKTVYALTSKRILIRTGFIGVDYRSLDYKMVGALAVNTNWMDKLFHKNTGTISFGSMASPMMANNVSRYNFIYVLNTYETYKEIKSYIDQKQNKEMIIH